MSSRFRYSAIFVALMTPVLLCNLYATNLATCDAQTVAKLPLCADGVLNGDCRVELSRKDAPAPLPFKLKVGAVACVRVTKLPAETIEVETEVKDVAKQDPFAAIAAAFVPILKSAVVSVSVQNYYLAEFDPEKPGKDGMLMLLMAESEALDRRARTLIDAQSHWRDQAILLEAKLKAAREQIEKTIAAQSTSEYRSAHELFLNGWPAPTGQSHQIPAIWRLKADWEAIARDYAAFRARNTDVLDLFVVSNLDANMSVVAANQAGIEDSYQAFADTRKTILKSFDMLPVPLDATDVFYYPIRSGNMTAGAGRTITAKFSTQAMVSREKKLITSVVVTWGVATRWELSTGLLFSNLRTNSYSNAVVFEAGMPVLNRYKVTEAKTIPTVVPAALIHYRLSERQRPSGRTAWLATVGAGVNAASTSADFAGGLSFAWKSFVLSFLAHSTRDLRLTNGYGVGLELPAATPTPTTERSWVLKGAIGLSYRINIP
ncbi:hypothetical protein F183_A41050 [Bryobacterales bacterium F-183]|nr:hypothetical protein F183_A41050 [Bryobacterales bacterium F-183]